MKIRDDLKLLESDGWYLGRTKGSHRQYKHHSKPGLVTVSRNPNADVPPRTLNSIMKRLGIKR